MEISSISRALMPGSRYTVVGGAFGTLLTRHCFHSKPAPIIVLDIRLNVRIMTDEHNRSKVVSRFIKKK